MNIAILPKMPDEDTLGSKLRDREAGAAQAGAFEGELKGAEGRARMKAEGSKAQGAPEPQRGETADEAATEDGGDRPAMEAAGPRDVLSLLAAVSQGPDGAARARAAEAGPARDAPSGEARPASVPTDRPKEAGASASEPPARLWTAAGGPEPLAREWVGVGARSAAAERSGLPGADGPAVPVPSAPADPATRDLPRSRLVVAHQETHFEPVSGEAVLVEADEAATPSSSDEGDIVRLLDAKAGERPVDRIGARAPDVPVVRAPGQVAAEAASRPAGPDMSSVQTARPDAPRIAERRPVPAAAGRTAEPVADGPPPSEDVAPQDRPVQGARLQDVLPARRAGGSDDRPAAPFGPAPARTDGGASRDADRFAAGPVGSPAGAPAPANVPAMSVQVAERIIDAFGGPSASRPVDEAPAASHLRLRAGGAALKTLTIQLQPENLGMLHVSMRLHEGQLMLEIAADKAETARMLTEDRASLRALLEKAGFSLEDSSIVVAVRETGPAAPSQGARDPSAGPDGRGAERGSAQGNGEGNGDRRGADGGAREEAARRRPEEAPTARPKPGGSTFL